MPSKYWIGMIPIALLGTLLFFFWPRTAAVSPVDPLKTFAACLSGKGAVMYGVDTCENCLQQKKMFGKYFEDIHYVNCDFQKKICQEKGITHYPVWIVEDHVRVGIQSLPELATFTACPLTKL